MRKIKNVLLASAFIVTTSVSANAATFTLEDDGVANNATIVAGSVNATDLGAGSVGTSEIIDGDIAAADLGASSVVGGTGGTIQDGSITSADLSAAVNSSITGNAAGITALNGEVNDLKGGVASAIAIATIPGVPAGKQFAVGLGGGTYDGENAGALKLSFAPQSMQSVQVNGSVTFSDSNTGAGVGVSYGF